MAEVLPTVIKPPLKLMLSTGKEIKMTYGLEMDIRRMLPDPATALSLATYDARTQDIVVRRCLTDSKKMIHEFEDLIPFEEIDITSEDVEAIIHWAVGHTLYFFVTRAGSMGSLAAQFQLAPPTPSMNGLEDSASTMPSAGPSE